MKREVMTAEQALKEGMQLPFALIRTWEQVCLGPTPAQSPAPETLLEARFFDGDREIRLFRPEEAICAVSLTREPEDRILEERYELEERFGRSLTCCRHLGNDSDGQTVFTAARLSHWEGD